MDLALSATRNERFQCEPDLSRVSGGRDSQLCARSVEHLHSHRRRLSSLTCAMSDKGKKKKERKNKWGKERKTDTFSCANVPLRSRCGLTAWKTLICVFGLPHSLASPQAIMFPRKYCCNVASPWAAVHGRVSAPILIMDNILNTLPLPAA